MLPRTLTFLAIVALLAATPFLPAGSGAGPITFSNFQSPSTFPNQNGAGEPSLGIELASNAAFFQAYTSTYKVTFDATGAPAWSLATAKTSITNNDPILFTDQVTGRTFAGGLGPYCSLLQYTDDNGATWIPMANPCPYPANDHPSIGGGPWHDASPLAAVYPDAVYLCQQSGSDVCVTSLDGGLTFGAPVHVTGDCRSFHGHIKVASDGAAYVPDAYCGPNQGGFVSLNNGGAWISYHIPGSRVQANGGGFDPSVATTPDGTVYEAWGDGVNNHPMVARSTNHGATWDRIVDLANTTSPPIVDSTFQAAVAGADGNVAVAYLASTDGTGNPFSGNFRGTWDLYISYSFDGGLTWSTVKATTDPVQRGCIYDVITSPSCHRNLLDFMDASVDVDGRVLVAYADGCISATCVGPNGTIASSSDARATIARQMTGPALGSPVD